MSNLKWICGCVLVGCAVGNVAQGVEVGAAAATAPVATAPVANVTIGAVSTRLGGEFRAELLYDNHGIEKRTGYKPQVTSTLAVSRANLLLGGELNANTEYAFRFNLLNPASTPLDYGYGTHWFSRTLGFSIGKERILQGGWDHLDQGYRTHVEGAYAQNLAMKDFDSLAALHIKASGLITLQVVNDVTADATSINPEVNGRWNKTAHPTLVLGWLGEFGPIRPLIDFGSYDNNKSRWFDVGLKAQLNAIRATLDYHNDSVAYRATIPGASGQKEVDTKTSYTVNVSYEVRNLLTPWLYYSYYDNKEASDGSAGLSNRRYNSSTPSATSLGGYTYAWNDNGLAWGAGVDFEVFGKNWNPFLAYVGRSGRFLKEGVGSESERRLETTLKVGILGQI